MSNLLRAMKGAAGNFCNNPTGDSTVLLIHSNTTDTSTTFTDSSTSNHTITAVGDAQHSTTQSKFGATGIKFDGTGDYITVAHSTDFNWSSAFTIEMWFWYTGSGDQILHVKRAGETANNIRIHTNNTNGMGWLIGSSWNIILEQSGLTVASNNTWHHVAVSWDGTTYRFFLDGTQISSTANTNAPDTTSAQVTLGAGQSGGSPLNGYLDEIRFSNTARYTSNFTPSTTAWC